jgi:hypothetical protein
MADWPTYPTDAAIGRLPGVRPGAALAAPDHAVLPGSVSPTEGSSQDDGWQSASGVGAVAVVVIGLGALVIIGRRSTARPTPSIRYDLPVDPWWPEW